jgi:hypothetical protein
VLYEGPKGHEDPLSLLLLLLLGAVGLLLLLLQLGVVCECVHVEHQLQLPCGKLDRHEGLSTQQLLRAPCDTEYSRKAQAPQ